MKTERVDPEVSLYLDGRLPPERVRAIEECIAADPVLAEQAACFRETRELVRASAALALLPPGFDARLRQRLHSADLAMKARERAKRENRGGNWWSRGAFGLGGAAAGVALMLAFAPSDWLRSAPTTPAWPVGGAVALEPVGGAPLMSERDVTPLLQRQYDAWRDLLRQVHFRGQVHPRWLYGELSATGIAKRNERLLTLVENMEGPAREDYSRFLCSFRDACSQLENEAKRAIDEKRTMTPDDVSLVLSQVYQLSRFQRPVSGGGDLGSFTQELRRTLGDTGESSFPEPLPLIPRAGGMNIDEDELSDFIDARRAFVEGRYQDAAEGFQEFIDYYPDSPFAQSAGVYAARAMLKGGETAGALRAVLDMSREDMQVLTLLPEEERAALRANALEIIRMLTGKGK